MECKMYHKELDFKSLFMQIVNIMLDWKCRLKLNEMKTLGNTIVFFFISDN